MKKVTEETKIKHQVKDYLRLKGWFIFHNLAGTGVYKGIPDFIAVKEGFVIFLEIKTPEGKLSQHQKEFQKNIEDHNGNYFVCRSLEDAIKLNVNIDEVTYYENK